tara:strand:+ start:249 stop:530 length:282 start_codon:yes stop_codon:yes gene_type:complete
MKPTENLEQLLARFTKRIAQIKAQEQTDKTAEQLHYLRGCKETIEYLMTGKLPNDGNHDGMKDHKPENYLAQPIENFWKHHKSTRHNNLDSLD